jgi:inhibitor of the pro-sigma K processing machinery
MALLESILTIIVIIGIAALTIYLITRAVHVLLKLVCNSIGGLILLFLAAFFGSSFGLHIAINLWTILLALFTGVFGVIAMILFQLIF